MTSFIYAQPFGIIQIDGEAGVQVSLDGTSMGATPVSGGLPIRLEKVPSGDHRLKFEKPGLKSAVATVQLEAGGTVLCEVKALAQELRAQVSKKSLYVLSIRTFPSHCFISIPALHVESAEKTADRWVLPVSSAGDFPVTLRALGLSFQATVRASDDAGASTFIDLLEERIEDGRKLSGAGAPAESVPAKNPPATGEKLLDLAERDLAGIQAKITQLETHLGENKLAIDDIRQTLKLRESALAALAMAESVRAEAVSALDNSRETVFRVAYRKYNEIEEKAAQLPESLRANVIKAAWTDLAEQLHLDNVMAKPVALFWCDHRIQALVKPTIGDPGAIADLNIPLVWLNADSFVLGSSDKEKGRDIDESPQTRVRFSQGFWLGKYEVTQGAWAAIMQSHPSHFASTDERAPVESISWNEAMEFCRRLTIREQDDGRLPQGYVYRLPTEAQWEYACRAGNTPVKLAKVAWHAQNSGATPHPVGCIQPNAWGFYDLLGNVAEWCFDWKEFYPGGEVSDFIGPSFGSLRAIRGASWSDPAASCRAARRDSARPDERFDTVGFRLCLTPDDSEHKPR